MNSDHLSNHQKPTVARFRTLPGWWSIFWLRPSLNLPFTRCMSKQFLADGISSASCTLSCTDSAESSEIASASCKFRSCMGGSPWGKGETLGTYESLVISSRSRITGITACTGFGTCGRSKLWSLPSCKACVSTSWEAKKTEIPGWFR